MPLCSICLSINFSTILRPDIKGYPEPAGGWPTNFELYYYNARDWRDNDSEKLLVPHQESLENLEASARSCELCRLIERCVSETVTKIKASNDLGFPHIPESNYTFWLSGRKEADGFQIIGCHNELRHQYRVMGGAGVCVRKDSPLACVVKGRRVSPDPMFSSMLADIPNLIEDCKYKHGHVEHEKGEAPTRILRIKDNGQTITLSEGNMNIEGRMTRVTGHESARMAKVYGNSTITIAASRAANSSEGFLEKHTQRNYIAAPFRYGQVSGEILIFPLHVRNVGDTSRYARLEDEPLTNRGWVMQERYLSPRTIHFDSSQVCFECKRAFITEDGCSASPSRLNWQYKLPTPNSWETDWKQVVRLYSQRKLTMKTDKLPAIAGIAEYFSNIAATASIDSHYLAGLWRNNIIFGLCWQIDPRKGFQRREGQYRAPTWSWASLDSAIWFPSVKYPLATFQNAHVTLDSHESPFGKVTGGWIRLRARKYLLLNKAGNNTNFTVSFHAEGPNFDISVFWEDQEVYSSPTITDLVENGPYETPFMTIPLACRESGADSDADEVEIVFIVVKAVENGLPSCGGVQPFQRVGSTTLKLRKTDRDSLESLGLYYWMNGYAKCLNDELGDVILI
ncbi:hypothetical protein BFJ71_g6896 [Fusarium oxysporum]|nr:hypothetical protein BFJ71_g6896 [Fusarium oxysporum]